MYKKFAELLEKTHKTIYRVSSDTGISTTTLYDWRDGRSQPKLDKLVSIEYFINDEPEQKEVG